MALRRAEPAQSGNLRRFLLFFASSPPVSVRSEAEMAPAAGMIAVPTKGLRQFFPFVFSHLPCYVIFLSLPVLTFGIGWPYKALIERGAAALLALVPLALSFLD
ncbi:hypothetical protein BTR14_07535 [Rhizobium rhizosphaerae]|uniref:Uncharacterized protein n=1 Tax=Xaviernesmea rhizosphaerae TaxID=1672749 RepID=A0ABX3PGJ0_9HYPH|nr:hypothetical protein [Xaviernesmea rhizosphaerae]OQP87256.1 hypothetical protein BTR14_07535 [Xaviernesmea rhizosphaerae]